jgi:hypothetical protein
MKQVIQQTADKYENCTLCYSLCISLFVRHVDLEIKLQSNCRMKCLSYMKGEAPYKQTYFERVHS